MHEKTKNRIADAALFIILGTIFIYPLTATILSGTILEYTDTGILWMCFCFTFVASAVFFNKKTLLATCVTLVLSGLFIYAQTFAVNWYATISYPLVESVYNGYLFATGYIPYSPEHAALAIAGIVLLLTLLATISLYWSFSFYPAFTLGAIVFVITWAFDREVKDIHVLMFLFVMAILFVRKLNSASKNKNQAVANSKLAFVSMPIFALVFAICMLIPNPDIGYNRQAFVTFFEDPKKVVQDFIYFTFNPKYFSLNSTGFGNIGGRLGGRVELSSREVMRVYSDERIYLVGGYKDTYTGESWLGSYSEFMPYEDTGLGFSMESAEVIKNFLSPAPWGDPDEMILEIPVSIEVDDDPYALPSGYTLKLFDKNNRAIDESTSLSYEAFNVPIYLEPDGTERYVSRTLYNMCLEWSDAWSAIHHYTFDNEVVVDIGDARTGTLFTADKSDKSLSILDQPENKMLINGNNSVRAEKVLPKDSQYSFTYTKIDYDSPQIAYILNNFTYDSFYSDILSGEYPAELNSEIRSILESWNEEAKRIREAYTNLPETLPQRVYDLAEEITEGLSSDYEKAKAIESYLLENFKYTLSPESLPLGADFVDNFLFEQKEGYCVYFATSMAVLSRCVGIPARYVEGYSMPSEKTDDSYYLVTGEYAHAWTDIYLEGFGWMPFEPTPLQHQSYAGAGTDLTIFSENFLFNPLYDKYLGDYGVDGETLEERRVSGRETGDETGVLAIVDGIRGFLPVAGTALVSMLGLFVLFAAYKALRIKLFFLKLKRISITGQAIMYFDKIMKIWEYDGFFKNDYETPTNFVKSLPTYKAGLNRLEIANSVEIYYKATFSRDGITDEELNKIRDTWSVLYNNIVTTSTNPKASEYLKRLFKYW